MGAFTAMEAICEQGYGVCRYAFDLRAGSAAYLDSGREGSHITFSGDQQLTGWQAASAPLPALGLRPRLFVVYQDGSGYEVLDNDVFASYVRRQVGNFLSATLQHSAAARCCTHCQCR